VLNEKEYRESIEKFGGNFKAGMGAEAVKNFLRPWILTVKSEELREEVEGANGQKKGTCYKAP
jgi:DNA-directed RNA polymerase subunit beta'